MKRNIKRFILLAVLMVPLAMMAQVKIATVDVQAIFELMPETKAANEALDKLSHQYKTEFELMQQEFNSKYASYQSIAGDDDIPATIRDRRVREIQDSNREIEAFLDKSQSALLEKKKELEKPIYDKINAAIKQVGDAGGYTYILDVSKTPLAYVGSGAIDLTASVKKVLGI